MGAPTRSACRRLRDPHPYLGMWVTADGYIRQELLPNGRYDEARGDRRSAVTGNHLDYVDDTGFTATGDIRDGVLYHEHLVLYREGDGHARPTSSASSATPRSHFDVWRCAGRRRCRCWSGCCGSTRRRWRDVRRGGQMQARQVRSPCHDRRHLR
ncbi:putative secreted protein [Streptomyces himastatinicus ATCC 53653]|uniref:Putative secreted protein n=1 Tax=Streptomyces himastatinicus ATCC 53653 TaxID=457427 RepID=D9WKR1_9ACTN|nr:putative secreted protein [Streptomyces himastatinicus ATCC 53653]